MVSVQDVRLYEVLADTLSQRYGQTEIAEILSSVKTKYLDDYLPKYSPDVVNDSILSCRACDNVSSGPATGWWNHTNPDLLIVASNTHNDSYWMASIGGYLKAVGFSSAFVGAIHITKCGLAKIETDNINNCYPFTYQQIDLCRPRAIVVVGAPAFDLFRTNQGGYKEAIGSSWWWGLYKVYCLPPVKDFHNESSDLTYSLLQQAYQHIYGISPTDLITIVNE